VKTPSSTIGTVATFVALHSGVAVGCNPAAAGRRPTFPKAVSARSSATSNALYSGASIIGIGAMRPGTATAIQASVSTVAAATKSECRMTSPAFDQAMAATALSEQADTSRQRERNSFPVEHVSLLRGATSRYWTIRPAIGTKRLIRQEGWLKTTTQPTGGYFRHPGNLHAHFSEGGVPLFDGDYRDRQ
jgi:hypothetical protein